MTVQEIDVELFNEVMTDLLKRQAEMNPVAVASTRSALHTIYYLMQEAGEEHTENIAQALQGLDLPDPSSEAKRVVDDALRTEVLALLGERLGAAAITFLMAYYDYAVLRAAHFAASVAESPRSIMLSRRMGQYTSLLTGFNEAAQSVRQSRQK